MFLLYWFGRSMVEVYVNLGIALGLSLAVIILLRPITNPLLRPRYRVGLWMVSWIMGWTWSFYELVGMIQVLPVTLRGWIAPIEPNKRSFGYIQMPDGDAAGAVDLPGGASWSFDLSPAGRMVFAVAIAGMFVLIFIWSCREEWRIKSLSRRGDPLSEQWHRDHGIDPDYTSVRIMDDIPTSFVCRTGIGYHNICLQKQLPEEQMELVLKHELAHIRGRHAWFKSILSALLFLYWWNPIMWAAYRLTCRDVELACDESVMNTLDPRQRKEYARTLVELGSGKHMWTGLTCFGECDAAIRVRRSVKWSREAKWEQFLIWPAIVLLFLFLFTSPAGSRSAPEGAWERYVAEEMAENLDHFSLMTGIGEISEIRVNYKNENERHLLVHTGDGKWYLHHVEWRHDQNRFRARSCTTVNDPEKYKNFVPLEGWK